MLKSIFVAAVAGICLYIALVLMPWSELQFGLIAKQIPGWAEPLVNSPLMKPLAGSGKDIVEFLTKQGAAAQFGDYMYGFCIFIILTLIGLAYIVVGREEAEEKLILPVKK
jgi:hypothetical protein